jgi:hypothetical protein
MMYPPNLLRAMRFAFDAACKQLSNETADLESRRIDLARRIFVHVDEGERDQEKLAFLALRDIRKKPRTRGAAE